MMELQPGDILVRFKRPKGLMNSIICFFTKEWWFREPETVTYHTELLFREINGIMYSITMEPYKCRLRKTPLSRRAIYRLKKRPHDFGLTFGKYVLDTLGRKYDYVEIICCVLNWIFRTRYFTDKWGSPVRDICSEHVARFYEKYVGVQCSLWSADMTVPDDILDYLEKEGSERFELIMKCDDPRE